MAHRTSTLSALLIALTIVPATPAVAQPLGSFTWQLQPFCNRVTVNVRQDGAVYTLDGFDDQCGAARRAPLTGLATLNPDGSVGLGLAIVTGNGQAVHVDARIALTGLSGTWTDSAGNSGPFAFGANAIGTPRPAVVGSGDITAVTAGTGLVGGGSNGDVALSVNGTVVQNRVAGTCAANEAIRVIGQDGSVVCQPVAGGTGDITAVGPGIGLLGGGSSGDVTLSVAFGGDGFQNAVARVDHEHAAGGADSVGVGAGALATATLPGNTAVGANALGSLTLGANNTALGASTGGGLTLGNRVTLLGSSATAGGVNLTNATAIGANARVDASDTVVLGAINGLNGATTETRVGIGSAGPLSGALDITHRGAASIRITRHVDLTEGPRIEFRSARGTQGAPAALLAGDNLIFLSGHGHTGTEFTNTLRAFLVAEASENWTPTATGTRWRFSTTSNGSVTDVERLRIDHDGEIGINTNNPQATLHVNGTVRFEALGTAGATTLCRNASNEIATCSSSLRYKDDVEPFTGGIDLVHRLRPIGFTWKQSGGADIGFAAEEVAGLDPRLATFNDNGDVEGVKYDRLTAVLVNAVNELEARLQALQRDKETLERRLALLESSTAAGPNTPKKD
jgi:hypothetical protein